MNGRLSNSVVALRMRHRHVRLWGITGRINLIFGTRIMKATLCCLVIDILAVQHVSFSSPILPSWLKWDKGRTLGGIPDESAATTTITIIASYTIDEKGELHFHCVGEFISRNSLDKDVPCQGFAAYQHYGNRGCLFVPRRLDFEWSQS
jgi:hypothetical protein